jgi:antitoxin component HigA of HigAB toxin-antitoxin module
VSSVKPIRTQADHEAALARIDALIGATPGSPEEDELALLADLVDEYEKNTAPDRPRGQSTRIRHSSSPRQCLPHQMAALFGSV